MKRFIAALLCTFLTSGLIAQAPAQAQAQAQAHAQLPAPATATAPVVVLPDAVRWATSPALPGVQSAWFVGGPEKPGMYALRIKLAPGAKIPPHTHPDERFTVVLSGTILVGFGEVFDERNLVAVPAGGVYVAPAGMAHHVWAKDGEAVYQESGIGPTATNFVKR